MITNLATEAGITTQQLSDFLAGDRTLRSDVLDRLTAAVGASLIVVERRHKNLGAEVNYRTMPESFKMSVESLFAPFGNHHAI